MFKILAELGAGRRHMVPQAAPAHCNHNRPERRPAAALKHPRPQLTCHWGTAAAGSNAIGRSSLRTRRRPKRRDQDARHLQGCSAPLCAAGRQSGPH